MRGYGRDRYDIAGGGDLDGSNGETLTVSECFHIHPTHARESSSTASSRIAIRAINSCVAQMLGGTPAQEPRCAAQGLPKIRGTLFWGPYNKDPTI